MAYARLTICNKKGLHARAAAKLVKAAASFPDTQIKVTRLPRPGEGGGPATAGATSILGLLMLAAEMGVDLELHAEGENAEAAVKSLSELVSRRFDEEE